MLPHFADVENEAKSEEAMDVRSHSSSAAESGFEFGSDPSALMLSLGEIISKKTMRFEL